VIVTKIGLDQHPLTSRAASTPRPNRPPITRPALRTPGKIATPRASLRRAGGIPLAGMATRASRTSQLASRISRSRFAASSEAGNARKMPRRPNARARDCLTMFTILSVDTGRCGEVECLRRTRGNSRLVRTSAVKIDETAAMPLACPLCRRYPYVKLRYVLWTNCNDQRSK